MFGKLWPEDATGDILSRVYQERLRQKDLVSQGKFDWDCSAMHPTQDEKLVVLAEEFGEVAKEVCEGMKHPPNVKALQTELIQVAAVCVAWAEALEKGVW